MKITIEKKDIQKEFYCAGGPGGQRKNKVATAARLTHIPTGIQAQCCETPSRERNLKGAWKLLISRLMRHYEEQNKVEKEKPNITFGNQVRTYRLVGQRRIDDHRTSCYTEKVEDFLSGGLPLDDFIREYLRRDLN